MKAKFGAIVVAGSGKLGGHVASRNRFGAYWRTKVTPVNPDTTYQAAVRNRLTGLSQAWRSLTAAQRSSWDQAVSDFQRTDVFGDIKNPSGFNLYQRLNNNLLQAGESAIDVAPLPEAVTALVTLSVAVDVGSGGYALTFTPAIPSGDYVKLFATPGQSAGKNFVKSEYRLLQLMDNADTSPFDFETVYEARFGTPAVGSKVFVKCVPMSGTSGQEGIALSASTIVVTT